MFVGDSPDLRQNARCPGIFSRDADIFCGLNGRFVGIRAKDQVL